MVTKQIYLITGASSDIGVNFIETLAQTGQNATVIAQYNSSKDQIIRLSKEIKNLKIYPLQCDLSDKIAVTDFVDTILTNFSCPTHILHIAASKFNYCKVKNIDISDMEKQMQISVYSLAQIAKVFVPQMKRMHTGKIVAVLSAFVLGVPPKQMTPYITTKYALLGLLKSLAADCAGYDVCINGISPNMIETKFLSNIDDRIIQMTANASAMKRNIRLEEVVSGINYLLSESSSYLNGVNLNLSGGDKM
jgi:3-oxoacyl-[acyl-carrier protein] reductase